jgi:hypothetical protein
MRKFMTIDANNFLISIIKTKPNMVFAKASFFIKQYPAYHFFFLTINGYIRYKTHCTGCAERMEKDIKQLGAEVVQVRK